MSHTVLLLVLSLLFLIFNMAVIRAVLALNRRTKEHAVQPPLSSGHAPGQPSLDGSAILEWEFEYARVTASEAMDDRHNAMNFYLLVVGVVASAVVTLLGQKDGPPTVVGTGILWTLCAAGWLYFLQIIRLRQAWYESSQVMNQIKEFFILHARGFDADVFRSAFRWTAQTLPAPGRAWTLYFLSAVLIGLLNSIAFVLGGAFIDLEAVRASAFAVLGSLVVLGLIFFSFHVWMYFEFLKPAPAGEAVHTVGEGEASDLQLAPRSSRPS